MEFQIWVRRIFIGHYLVQQWVLIFGWILCYDLRESKIGNLHDNLGTRILSLVLERALKKVPDPCARRRKRRRRGRRSRRRRMKDIKPKSQISQNICVPASYWMQ
jgi:hypothetical protein